MTEQHDDLGFDLPAPARASRIGVVVVLMGRRIRALGSRRIIAVTVVAVSVAGNRMRMRHGDRIVGRGKHVGARRPSVEHEQKHHEQPRDRRDRLAKLGR